MSEDLITELRAKQTIREQPFRSDKPIIGPIIVWLRTVWNNISTRWYVLPLLQQQNEFNASVVALLAAHLRDVGERLEEIDERLIDLDRDQTTLTRNVAELSYRLIRLDQSSTDVEARRRDRDVVSHET